MFRFRHTSVTGFPRCGSISAYPALHLPFPSSNRTCGFPASGFPVNFHLKRSHLPVCPIPLKIYQSKMLQVLVPRNTLGYFQHIPPIYPVIQCIKPKLRLLLGFSVELLSQSGELLWQSFTAAIRQIAILRFPAFRSGLLFRQAGLLLFRHQHVYSKAPSLRRHYPASLLLWAYPTPITATHRVMISPTALPIPWHYDGSPRLLDKSLGTHYPQSPRGARYLHSPVASTPIIGFAQFGRLTTPSFCVTRPNQVHLRYGSHLCRTRLRRLDYSRLRSFDYMTNRQLS